MSQQNDDNRKGFWGSTFSRLKSALSKTREAVVDSVVEVSASENNERQAPQLTENNMAKSNLPAQEKTVSATSVSKEITERQVAIDDDYLENLEDKLIRADLGLMTVDTLMQHLRKYARSKDWTSKDIKTFLKDEFVKMLANAPDHKLSLKEDALNIILVVGVNGTGKTTSIGKLSSRLQSEGKKVLIAAGDTFRAAAETQLEIWAQRAKCDLVRLASRADPGAVVYQAIKKAHEEKYDVLVIDTAGRLHNKANLMAELSKIQSVVDKNANGAHFEALLVLDASTGQNGVQQARIFSEVCPLTGVVLTKLDGSAKGGIVFSIANELKIPVKLIGLGEKIDDLQDFEPELFIEALFE